MNSVYWFDIVWSCVAVAVIVLLAVALAQIVQSRLLTSLGKTGWILFVLFVPIVGVVAWFIFNPSRIGFRAD